MPLTRRAFLASTAALAAGPAFADDTQSVGGNAFGSYWRLTLPANRDPGPARAVIEAVTARIDLLMSPWRPDSEITRLNRLSGDLLPAAPETLAVTRAALDAAEETGGVFDPTVGPLVARWGFGPIRSGAPGSWQGLRVGETGLRKDDPGLSLDFCGIAKGYALDLMRSGLDAAGQADYLLELGGEVAARGRHPAGRAWRVALDGAPVALALGDQAVATSGILAQSYRVGGDEAGHIIDPRAGRPATGALLSVSVLSSEGMRADALATALFVMDLDGAAAFAEARGVDALLLARDGDGTRLFATGAAAATLLG